MPDWENLTEKQFQAVVEAMNEGVVVTNSRREIVYINPIMKSILGYDPQDLQGKDVTFLILPEDREILEKQWAGRMAGRSSNYEVRLQARDGSSRPFIISAGPVFDVAGAYAGSVGVLSDLTEIHAARKAALRASDDWLHSFDAIEEMMMVTGTDYTVRQVNRAFCEAFEVTPEEAIGRRCYEIVHRTKEPPQQCCAPVVFSTAQPQITESNEIIEGRATSLSVSPVIGPDGQVNGTVHIFKDVSESRRQELQSTQLNQQLVESFKGITGAMSYVLESRDPYTAGHSNKVAEMAVTVGREMGLNENELEGLLMAGQLHDIGKAAIPLDILNKPGKLTEHEFGMIKAHPVTAYQALSAISFPWPIADIVRHHHERMDGSGYPDGIAGEEIHPWARILAVCDTVEAMTAHRPYRAALKMQDAFEVLKSGSGKAYDPEVVEICISVLGMSDKRIMVVDDDVDVLALVSRTLDRRGWEVVAFDQPDEAVRAFAESPCPVVLTDLVMPGMNGLDVLSRVKEVQPETEVILFTGFGEKQQVQQAMRLGAFDFLDKPFELAAIISTVRRARESYAEKS